MIRRLRIRITAVITAVMTVLVICVVGGIFLFMNISENRETDTAIDIAMDIDKMPDLADDAKHEPPKDSGEAPADGGNGGIMFDSRFSIAPHGEKNFFRNWIAVETDSDGEITSVSYSSRFSQPEDESNLYSAVKEIAGTNTRGYVSFDGVSYRYCSRQTDSGSKVVLMDRSSQLATMRRLIVTVSVIGAAAVVVVFVISIFLSAWVAKPIAEAWRKEKEFFADASHELKTPLTVIGANVDVITSNPDSKVAEQERWFGYIKSETEKMSKLITQMLYLAREDSREDPLQMTEFNFSEVTEGACLTFEALAFENNKLLETDICPDIYVVGDKERICRLVNILLDNAVKHSEENGRITVKLEKIKNKLCLTVSNTGAQIPKEELDRLFDRFYRTDKSRNGDTGGFGLGLAIAHKIAEQHGGTLSAESDSSGITSFVFRLRVL